MGKDIWKTFENVAHHGRVEYAHVLADSGEVLYHVVSVNWSVFEGSPCPIPGHAVLMWRSISS